MAMESKFGKLFFQDQRREWEGEQVDGRALRDWIDESRRAGSGGDSQVAFASLFQGSEAGAGAPVSRGGSTLRRSLSGALATPPLQPCSPVLDGSTDPLQHSRLLRQEPTPPGSPNGSVVQVPVTPLSKSSRRAPAPIMPPQEVARLIKHGALAGNQGKTELVVHSPTSTPRGATSDAPGGRRVWFSDEPVVSIQVFDLDRSVAPRMELHYLVPWWAWAVLVALVLAELPVLPLLSYTTHYVDHNVDGQAFLMHCLVEFGVAVLAVPVWLVCGGWKGNWGGETSLLRSRSSLPLVLSGLSHAAYHLTAVRSSYDSRAGCDDMSCPPLSLLNLAPVLVCLFQKFRGDALYWPDLVGSFLLVAGGLPTLKSWSDSLKGPLGTRGWLCAGGSSISLAVKVIADRAVAEMPPAPSLVIQRLVALLVATLFCLMFLYDDFGLWDADNGDKPDTKLMLQWGGGAALSWLTSVFIFFTLRHVSILVVAACVTAGKAVGVITIAPYVDWWGPWRQHKWWTATLTLAGACVGTVLVVWSQKHFRSRVTVPISDPMPSLRPVPRRASFERRMRWNPGDVLGLLLDCQRGHFRFGQNGSWILAFEKTRRWGVYFPAMTAGAGWSLRLLSPDSGSSCGPAHCTWLQRNREVVSAGPPSLCVIGDDPTLVDMDPHEGIFTYRGHATVGLPRQAIGPPNWAYYEVEVLSAGAGPVSFGWMACASRSGMSFPSFPGVGRDEDGLSWGVDGASEQKCVRWYCNEMLDGLWPLERDADWQGPGCASAESQEPWDVVDAPYVEEIYTGIQDGLLPPDAGFAQTPESEPADTQQHVPHPADEWTN